jgi:hypothetical protein
VQKFLMAMEEWQEANREYHQCAADCGSSPDYFCGSYREAMNRASAEMSTAFNEAVVDAIKSYIGASK